MYHRNLIIRHLIPFIDKNVKHSKIVEDNSIPSLQCPSDVNPLTIRLLLKLLSIESMKLIGVFLISYSPWSQGKAREILTGL